MFIFIFLKVTTRKFKIHFFLSFVVHIMFLLDSTHTELLRKVVFTSLRKEGRERRREVGREGRKEVKEKKPSFCHCPHYSHSECPPPPSRLPGLSGLLRGLSIHTQVCQLPLHTDLSSCPLL